MRPLPVPLTVLVVVMMVATGCNTSERVDLGFRPSPGAVLRYETTVDATITTELAGPPRTRRETILLEAEEQIRERTATSVAMTITIDRDTSEPRSFDVRLDRTAGVITVETVEGLPVEALGELGPSRLILVSAGLLPDRELRPGAEWGIERSLDLPDADALLTGTGRLVRLKERREGDLAEVEVVTVVPVRQTMELTEGTVTMDGNERTVATIDYRLDDGTVQAARSTTRSTFDLTVEGAARSPGPVTGNLSATVESRTDRVTDAA